mmetsp:Transcript_25961/g.54884  ORF Transcript_25961/g.54884 Transcript_25961/m.54884 type:complete len:215 (-) Transcript_25961:63-707(-)
MPHLHLGAPHRGALQPRSDPRRGAEQPRHVLAWHRYGLSCSAVGRCRNSRTSLCAVPRGRSPQLRTSIVLHHLYTHLCRRGGRAHLHLHPGLHCPGLRHSGSTRASAIVGHRLLTGTSGAGRVVDALGSTDRAQGEERLLRLGHWRLRGGRRHRHRVRLRRHAEPRGDARGSVGEHDPPWTGSTTALGRLRLHLPLGAYRRPPCGCGLSHFPPE